MDETKTLHLAREAIQCGDKATAQKLLAQVIKANSRNEIAWLWLSAIVDDPARERECLERVIAINPKNEIAQHHLQRLNQPESMTQEDQTTSPSLKNSSMSSLPVPELADKSIPKSNAQKVKKKGSLLYIGIGALMGLFSCWGILAISAEIRELLGGWEGFWVWGILFGTIGGLVGRLVPRWNWTMFGKSIAGISLAIAIALFACAIESLPTGWKVVLSFVAALIAFFTIRKKE
jgi:hypothetical protein